MNFSLSDKSNLDLLKHVTTLTGLIESQKIDQAGKIARSGRLEEAQAHLEHVAFSNRDTQLKAWLLLAKICAQQGRKQKATHYFQKVITAEPDHQEAIQALAHINTLRPISPLWLTVKSIIQVCVMIGLILTAFWFITDKFNTLHHELTQSQAGLTAMTQKNISRLDKNVAQLTAALEKNQDQLNQSVQLLHTNIEQTGQTLEQQFETFSSNLLLRLDRYDDSLLTLQTDQQKTQELITHQIIQLDTRITGLLKSQKKEWQTDITRAEITTRQEIKNSIETLAISFQQLEKQFANAENTRQKETETVNSNVVRIKKIIDDIASQIEVLQSDTTKLATSVREISQSPSRVQTRMEPEQSKK